jgi:hypothetical protein
MLQMGLDTSVHSTGGAVQVPVEQLIQWRLETDVCHEQGRNALTLVSWHVASYYRPRTDLHIPDIWTWSQSCQTTL